MKQKTPKQRTKIPKQKKIREKVSKWAGRKRIEG